MRYIIRKYIHAESAKEAIKKDKNCPVHDVWVCEDWKKVQDPKSDYGFDAPIKKTIGEK